MRLILCPAILFISIQITAQSIERQVIAAGGESVSNNLRLDFTIGEIAVETANFSDKYLTQGFHQPAYIIISGNNVFPYLVIYPNPTAGDAIARFILPSPGLQTITIYNELGQLIMSDKINYTNGEMQYIIRAAKLSQGLYFIKFTAQDGKSAVSKLLKH
jgi:hypothetical protein